MRVLVDTSVWSQLLRRNVGSLSPEAAELKRLIENAETAIIGPIRQELLTGFRDDLQFQRLKRELSAFPDHFLSSHDFEAAAQVANSCRRSGVQGSPVDFLICAVAIANDLAVFTADRDFARFSRVVPVRIHEFVSP